MPNQRIAIVGLYRSGSSALAGVLHHLGVNLGEQFFRTHFEETELADRLRQWWDEPRLIESSSCEVRREFLRAWMAERELQGIPVVAAKHPLLSLCGDDLVSAWGSETICLWSYRDFETSVRSLHHIGWQWPNVTAIQQRLWDALVAFDFRHPMLRIDYQSLLECPQAEIESLVERLNLTPSQPQLDAACQFINSYRHSSLSTHAKRSESEPSALAAGLSHPPLAVGPDRPMPAASVGRPTLARSAQIYQHDAPASDNPYNNRQPKIVATMLAGNSESLVKLAVWSAIGLVDEFLLIDTGITDRTIEIVSAIAKHKFRLVPFTWCNDFAAARNFALHAAEQCKADWALTVDTDERFQFPADFNRAQLDLLLLSNENTLAWMLPVRDGNYSKERFIRLPTKLAWVGRTHEALTGFGDNQRQTLPHGYFWEPAKSPAGHEFKLQRDLAVLSEEVVAKPKDPRWWFYLAQTYEGLNQVQAAADAYRTCALLDGWQAESGSACFRAAMCLKELGAFRQAEETAALGLTRVPKSAELLWIAGFCAYQQGALQRAIQWCELAVACGDYLHPDFDERRLRPAFRYPAANFEAPFDVLRFAYHRTDQPVKYKIAEAHFHRAKKVREDVGK